MYVKIGKIVNYVKLFERFYQIVQKCKFIFKEAKYYLFDIGYYFSG